MGSSIVLVVVLIVGGGLGGMLTIVRLGIVRNVSLGFRVSRLYVCEIRSEKTKLAFLVDCDLAAKQSRKMKSLEGEGKF